MHIWKRQVLMMNNIRILCPQNNKYAIGTTCDRNSIHYMNAMDLKIS